MLGGIKGKQHLNDGAGERRKEAWTGAMSDGAWQKQEGALFESKLFPF